MKKKNKIIIGTILLSFTTIVTLIAGDSNGEVARGNGEVTLKDNCFKDIESATQCIKDLHPKINLDSISLDTILDKALKAVTGRGGDAYTVNREINLTNQKRFIIYADISKAKKPVTVNIPNSITTQNQTRVTIDMNTRDIKNKIILQNKEGKVLIQYKVVK